MTFAATTVTLSLGGCGGSSGPPSSTSSSSGLLGAAPFKSTARFHYPGGIDIDGAGNLYVADTGNSSIRLITPAGKVTTIDGVYSGLEMPTSITMDGPDQLSANGDAILEIEPDRSVDDLAGALVSAGNLNGPEATARFNGPGGTALDRSGNIYIADSGNNEIRKIAPDGTVTTLAGSGAAGFVNGTGSAARFWNPLYIAVDAQGFVYVSDYYNNAIRMISPQGVVSTLAGTGAKGSANGAGAAATFYGPSGIAVGSNGYVYVADHLNNEIRGIAPGGMVTLLAGALQQGATDGSAKDARFNFPMGVAIDASGNLYIADAGNNEIRELEVDGTVVTIAGSTAAGNLDGTALPRTP